VSVAVFISSQRAEHGVPHVTGCRALGVSPSWFYKWSGRPASRRQQRRAELAAAVRAAFDASGSTYGSPRITAELHAAGWQVSKNTVAAVMADQRLIARPKRRRRCLTRADKTARRAPDLVGRDFTAAEPNLKWCGDLTEIPTDEGKLYLATVLDLGSRRLPGFAVGDHHDSAAALSSAEPTRPMDWTTPRERQAPANGPEVYSLPWSVWKMTPPTLPPRTAAAIRSEATANSASCRSLIAKPSSRRETRSSTAAR